MSYGIVCRQVGCQSYATHRFTWAGKPETFACDVHANRAKLISDAMGYPLQIIPLSQHDHAGPEGMKSLDEQRK